MYEPKTENALILLISLIWNVNILIISKYTGNKEETIGYSTYNAKLWPNNSWYIPVIDTNFRQTRWYSQFQGSR